MVLITRPRVTSTPATPTDISSQILNNNFSSTLISNGSTGSNTQSNWNYRVNGGSPVDMPLGRGTTVYGEPGFLFSSPSGIDNYAALASDAQYWLSQNNGNGQELSATQSISVTGGYSQIRVGVAASARNEGRYDPSSHFLELSVGGTEQFSTSLLPANLIYWSNWITTPSGVFDIKIDSRREGTSDSTIYITKVFMQGR
jgi:hypothetical protein